MKELGIKKLDLNNWMEKGKVLKAFAKVLENGVRHEISPVEWFDCIYKAKLEVSVPENIHKLFEVARGTMTYGYFFYPIFTLAAEQFTRIIQTAVIKKCEMLNIPKSYKSIKTKIKWLSKHTNFTKISLKKWEQLVSLRNSFSHPTDQMIVAPAMAIELMEDVADEINYLFKQV